MSDTPCWFNPATGQDGAWNYAGNDTAVFTGTAGTVILPDGFCARSLVFQTGGYSLQGGPIAMPSNGTTINVVNTNDTAQIESAIGGGGLTKTGGGSLLLSGSDTLGEVDVNGGTLVAGSTAALGGAALTLDNNGILDLAGNSLSVSNLNSSSTQALVTNNGPTDATLTVQGSDGDNGVYGGTITDGSSCKVSLTVASAVSSSYQLALVGSNTYTGGTEIDGGTLDIQGSVTGSVTVDGGTLSGSGSIGGDLAINDAATFSPGNAAPETLAVGGAITISDAGLTLPAAAPANNAPIVLLQGASSVSGHFTALVNGPSEELLEGTPVNVGGQSYNMTYCYNASNPGQGSGNDVALVPATEPSIPG